MSDFQQELSRSLSMPVLKSEEAVLKKIQEQDGIISLIQTQIEFQSEVIAKHDKIFEDILEKVGSLTSKVKDLEESLSKRKEAEEQEDLKSALWASTSSTTGSTDKKVSVAEMAREVAESAEATLVTESGSGYVYDETLGLFYDQNSGYYYDPVKQLFYNGHTEKYYKYDTKTNTYIEVDPKAMNGSTKRKKSKKQKRVTKKQQVDNTPASPNLGIGDASSVKEEKHRPLRRPKSAEPEFECQIEPIDGKGSDGKTPSDMEEGELSSSAPTSAESSPQTSSTNDSCDNTSETENQSQCNYPPCVRAVVQVGPTDLKKGTLFLVPCTGGTIGSKGSSHAILLPCPSVEKKHAKIEYIKTKAESPKSDSPSTSAHSGKYYITDLGSTEGTFLNRTRLSESGESSDRHELVHGSMLQIGEVSLLIHIHPGDFTCGHCEPGLILQKDPMYEYTGTTSDKIRKQEMKKVKKKYGLDPKSANSNPSSPPSLKYKDRAKIRRVKVGSDNPFAKTEVATTEQPIKESNKGFKMLQKMGWKGEGLGSSEGKGIKEPISCDLKADRSGLGFQGPSVPQSVPSSSSKESTKKAKNLAITRERFDEANANSESPKDISNLDY